MDGPGGVGGSVLDIDPDAGGLAFAEGITLLRYLGEEVSDEGGGVHREVQVSVEGGDPGDEAAGGLDLRGNLLRDGDRGHLEGFCESETGYSQIGSFGELLDQFQVGRGTHGCQCLDDSILAFRDELLHYDHSITPVCT